MLIEDAKEEYKQLWLLMQDMKKAFDLVSLEMLDYALKKIRIPSKGINFICNLFHRRSSRIITSLGLTNKFQIKDGIDQDEVISPLI